MNDLPLIQFDYKPSRLHIIDNGYTVMINYRSGSFISVGGRRSMHSNNSTFTGLARRRSTARATRWTWPSSVVFHVALRHPAKHENGGFRRREAPTENAALSPYFQGRLHPASRDNSRLTSAGATSKDGLSWRPYLRCARLGDRHCGHSPPRCRLRRREQNSPPEGHVRMITPFLPQAALE